VVESTWLRGEAIYAQGKIRRPSSVRLLTREP
jgi:hypothetical protein